MTEEQNKLAEEIERILAEYHRAVELDDASLLPKIMSQWCDLFFKPGASAILAGLREPATEAVLARALKNEAAFHCLLHHCQRALAMPGPHTFDKELSDGVRAAIAISHGEKTPMKLHFDNDWVKRTTATDPDVDIEAGPDIALKGKGASQGAEGVGLTVHEADIIAAAVQLVPLLEEGWDEYDAPEDQSEGARACDALIKAVNAMLQAPDEQKG